MNKLIVPIIALMTLCQAHAHVGVPKLVVMLTVEELRADLLQEIAPHLSEKGLKRLLEQGEVYMQAEHPFTSSDATAATAIIHTGTTAIANGIPARKGFERIANGDLALLTSIYQDDNVKGIGTTDRRSPKRLTSLTIADRLKQATNRFAKVFAVAPSAEEAITASGQNGDGAFWIDDFNAHWVTSAYYPERLPWYIDRLNAAPAGISQRITYTRWSTLYNDDVPYKILPYTLRGGKISRFKHSFSATSEGIARYKRSGLINDEIIAAAQQILKYGNLGADDLPDLLSLHLYAGLPTNNKQELSTELLDTYYRLDQAIATLLESIDKTPGLAQTLIALVGTGQAREYYAPKQVIGYFNPDRCKALLNMYLMAKYGQASWVQEVTREGQVYLNRKEIQLRKIDLHTLQEDAADFLLDFSGVQFAVADSELRRNAASLYESRGQNRLMATCLNRASHKDRGDVQFELLPGWVYGDPDAPSSDGSYKLASHPTVMVLFGAGTSSQKIDVPLDIRTLSYRLCKALRIRPPTLL